MQQFIARPNLPYAIPFADINEADRTRFATYTEDCILNERFHHTFCGPQQEPVAYCPNCEKPFTQFMAFNTNDPRLQLGEWNRDLRLLFCWRCNAGKTGVDYHLKEDAEDEWYTQSHKITSLGDPDGEYRSRAPFYYKVNQDQSVTLLQYAIGGIRLYFPYKDYPIVFPEAQASLFQLTNEVQTVLESRLHNDPEPDLDDDDPGPDSYDILGGAEWHQVGGVPYLYIGSYIMPCPLCSEPMPFLACIWDQCTDPRGFTGGSTAQVIFHACTSCFVLGAFEAID